MMEPTPIQEIPESLIEFNRARFKEEVSVGIFDLMQCQNVTRTRLAEMLGVQKSRISHMLTGSQNFRLDTIADAFLALGRAVHVTLGENPDEYRIPNDEANYITMDFSLGFVSTNIQGAEYGQGISGAGIILVGDTGGREAVGTNLCVETRPADDLGGSLANDSEEADAAGNALDVPRY